jgi:4-amino-4-deoxy-L-arabinose transferase-like glycosyltransferase
MWARPLRALAAITVAGAALRFATLGTQSFWLDEAATVNLLHKSFGSMLSGISAGESTPPLYYILAWLWAKLFGTSEAGLRSLSALIGTGTIPLAYALGRRISGHIAGLVAAALCAFNPLLVWYSQEARSYALLVLMSGLTLLALLAALERPTQRRLALWAAAGCAALATHYFAGFLVAPEAAWLLYRTGARRRAAVAAGAVVIAAAALLPLALHQRSTGAAEFISATSLPRRLAQIPKQFALGYQGPLATVLIVAAALLLAYAVLRLVMSTQGAGRDRAYLFAGLGVASIVAPLVLSVIGPDYLLARNVLAAWLPLGVAVAAGFAAPQATRQGIAAGALLCAIGIALVVAVAADGRYQRDDWRSAARALGTPTQPRAIVVTPASGARPLLLYLPGVQRVPPAGVDVKELDFVGMAPRLPGEAAQPPRPPTVGAFLFKEFARKQAATYTVVRERSPVPSHITATVGASSLDGRPAVVLYQR